MTLSLGRTANSPDEQPQIQRISKAMQIVRYLRRLKEGHCLLNVSFPGSDESYNTAILAIHPSRDTLVLDELNAHEGHQRLLQLGKFRVSARLNGIEYRFASALRRVERQGGLALYRVSLPPLMLYIQRREFYRVPVDGGTGIRVNLPLLNESRLRGALCDLSQTGLGARFDGQHDLKQGQVLPICSIVLPQGDPIRTQLEIRFARVEGQRNLLRLGGRFVNLKREQQRELARLVARLQRSYLRKHRY